MKTINDFYNNTEKVMLVDGDLLAYKLTSSLEEVIDWGNDNWTLWSDFKIAKQLWTQSIAFYMGLTKSKNPVICSPLESEPVAHQGGIVLIQPFEKHLIYLEGILLQPELKKLSIVRK